MVGICASAKWGGSWFLFGFSNHCYWESEVHKTEQPHQGDLNDRLQRLERGVRAAGLAGTI